MGRSFRDQFPDFPESDMPDIPAGFVDVSSELDSCPSFWSKRLRLRVSIDYADAEGRDDPDMPRFYLVPTDPFGESDPDGEWVDGNDWSSILQRIEQFRAASNICRKWLARLGDEFDPAMPGREYAQPMSGRWIKEYQSDMTTLLNLPADPYALIEMPESAQQRREMEKHINSPPVAIYRSRDRASPPPPTQPQRSKARPPGSKRS